jgi:site-specific recombinase XerD
MAKISTFEPFSVDIKTEVDWFSDLLRQAGLSQNTIDSYCWTLTRILTINGGTISPDALIDYREQLIEQTEPQTVNNRINGINRYLKEKDIGYRLGQVKIVNEQFNDKVISLMDYAYLKRRLKEDGNLFDYFLVWALGCTGARVSEIVQLKIEHIYDGIFRIYGKGTKARTIFLSKNFCAECKDYIQTLGRDSGYLFQKSKGVISKATAETRVKALADKYNIDPEVMYPHSFRHMFAKEFNKRNHDLVLLKDIMGHASINTTVMYCKPSLDEIKDQYNSIVDW